MPKPMTQRVIKTIVHFSYLFKATRDLQERSSNFTQCFALTHAREAKLEDTPLAYGNSAKEY